MKTSKTVITSSRTWAFPDFAQLWRYRELLVTMTLRDIQVRYKQTAIGIAWAVFQPVMQMVVFTLVFRKLGKFPSGDLPYPVFVLAGLLPWQLFNKALTQASASMVTLGGMMSKVYFPRLIAPLASVMSGVVDFAISFVVLLGVMLFYGFIPGATALLAPLFVALAFMAAFGASLWLSAINTEYRDVQQALPFLAQILMFLTPVLYPTKLVPEGWREIYALNPMVSSIEGFRWSLLGGKEPDPTSLAISSAVTLLIAVTGLVYFNRYEKTFVDRL